MICWASICRPNHGKQLKSHYGFCLFMTVICGSWPSKGLIHYLFFVFHSRKLCTCILLTIDHWRQYYSCLTKHFHTLLSRRYMLCICVTHNPSFFPSTHSPFTPHPSLDGPMIKVCQIPWWWYPFWVQCQDQRLEQRNSILSQTSHITLICHARSIAKAHIHPCACTQRPRQGTETAVLSPCV